VSTGPSDARPLPDVIRQAAGIPLRSVNDLARLANAIAGSGYYEDAKSPQRVAVKMLYALSMGFDPIVGLSGVDIIDGNPTPNAHFWTAAIERDPFYDYRVLEHSSERCTVEFLRRGEDGSWETRGRVTWTLEDAKTAGLIGKDNWRHYPRSMLFARAMTEGGRAYCPGLFGGVRAYTPEEIWPDQPVSGAHIDLETGEVIEMPADREPSAPAEGDLPPSDGPEGTGSAAQPSASSGSATTAPPAADPDSAPEAAVKPLPQRPGGPLRWSVASHDEEGKRYEVTRSHFEGAGRSWSLWSCECPDHRFRVKNRGERCKHVDDVLAELSERFEDTMRPEPAPPRLCTRCGSEWDGVGEICDACVAHEAGAGVA
jgi:hypothetical protein